VDFELFRGLFAGGLATFPVALLAWWRFRREPPDASDDALTTYYRKMSPFFVTVTGTLFVVGGIGALVTR